MSDTAPKMEPVFLWNPTKEPDVVGYAADHVQAKRNAAKSLKLPESEAKKFVSKYINSEQIHLGWYHVARADDYELFMQFLKTDAARDFPGNPDDFPEIFEFIDAGPRPF